jgi:hypothetical protein
MQKGIETILEDKNIKDILNNNLKENEGYLLGIASYSDDIPVEVFYGLTLDNFNLMFFSYKQTWSGRSELRKENFIRSLPKDKGVHIEREIKYEEMLKRIQDITENPNRYIISLRSIPVVA